MKKMIAEAAARMRGRSMVMGGWNTRQHGRLDTSRVVSWLDEVFEKHHGDTAFLDEEIGDEQQHMDMF